MANKLPILSGNDANLPSQPFQEKTIILSRKGQGVDLWYDENGNRYRLNYATLDELDSKVFGTTDAIVRNSYGDSATDAVSQKFFTDESNSTWNQNQW
jgi:hypothetical protein